MNLSVKQKLRRTNTEKHNQYRTLIWQTPFAQPLTNKTNSPRGTQKIHNAKAPKDQKYVLGVTNPLKKMPKSIDIA